MPIYRRMDLDSLVNLMGCKDLADLQTNHKRWVQAALEENDTSRQAQWTESIAAGSKSFVEEVKRSLGVKARSRSITGDNEQYQLRENVADFGNPPIEGFNTIARGDSDFSNTFFGENS